MPRTSEGLMSIWSTRDLSRSTFRLRAGDPDEKWARAGARDGRKCRPVVVPLAVNVPV